LLAAEQYIIGNEPGKAETILAKLITEAPDEYRAHELFGGALFLKGMNAARVGDQGLAAEHYEQAYRRYRTAVEVAAHVDPIVEAGLNQSAGEIASAAGLRAEALQHFVAAGRIDPSSPKHPLYEAQMQIQLGRPDKAQAALQRVLLLDPDEPYAHASLATVALIAGDSGLALEHIAEARRIEPDNLGIRIQEARIRRQLDQPRQALEMLLALDEAARAQEAVTSEIAACQRALGEPEDAARTWQLRYQHVRGQPNAWRSAVEVAKAWLDAGQREKAMWWYGQASHAAPGDPEVEELGQAIWPAGDR
jgi:predicted Zn-dependent protease